MADAARIVSAQIDPQINELKRQLALAAAQNAQGVQDTKAGYTYLAKSAGGNAAQIGSAYDTARSTTDKSYAQLQGALSSLYGGATSRTQAEMARLGLDQGGTDNITAGNTRDLNMLLGLAKNRQASADTTLNTLKTGFQSGARQGGEIAKATGQRKVDELGAMLRAMQMEMNGKIGDIEGSRAGLIEAENERLSNNALDRQLKELQLQQAKATAASGGVDPKDLLDAAKTKLQIQQMMEGEGAFSAYDFLQKAAGSDKKKATDLINIFKGLETSNYRIPDENGNYSKDGKMASPFSFNNKDALTHLDYLVKRHAGEGWGTQEAEALRRAIDIYFRKRQ